MLQHLKNRGTLTTVYFNTYPMIVNKPGKSQDYLKVEINTQLGETNGKYSERPEPKDWSKLFLYDQESLFWRGPSSF